MINCYWCMEAMYRYGAMGGLKQQGIGWWREESKTGTLVGCFHCQKRNQSSKCQVNLWTKSILFFTGPSFLLNIFPSMLPSWAMMLLKYMHAFDPLKLIIGYIIVFNYFVQDIMNLFIYMNEKGRRNIYEFGNLILMLLVDCLEFFLLKIFFFKKN